MTRAPVLFPFFGLRLSHRDSYLISTDHFGSFLLLASSPSAPVLPPFIPELCNFLLATVPPRRAEIGVRWNDFVEMCVVAERGGIGHDGDGGIFIVGSTLEEEEEEEEIKKRGDWARTKTNEPKENDEN
ncbi:unnamed protein product [Lasius platythorax]|uniref:Phosphoribosylamine--glycine ligase n=2 Tax=Lasius TaxID=488720 RepID=A0A0J7L5W6_LASNI|nr:phosphoribosylamine--glycine ligase [Lasius niger]